jgi:hypothetical protein
MRMDKSEKKRTMAAFPTKGAAQSHLAYGSNMSDSHAHDHCPLPSALIGGACGRLRGGRHVRYPDRGPLSNLLLRMLAYAGVPVRAIGDSTGGCSEV